MQTGARRAGSLLSCWATLRGEAVSASTLRVTLILPKVLSREIHSIQQ